MSTDQGGVGLVVVSHSATVAQAVARLAAQLTGAPDDVRIEAAGGTEDGGLGTSADLVVRAARAVDQGAGVALLADLGSAVLTVKALLAEGGELPERSVLVDAPLVEGAVAAAVAASAGADLEGVRAAAAEAYDYRKR
ncbi:dihydroxyacetone kinase phosphoryl donor subunit DhaM [Streptomyces sp. NRRL F-5630]|uniref:dihydroxyacetone kinase phosphoryl donor subunit DhaM n=1 Tax=Streptomyces sp. NRRL F-5630 TaxID=1463864 RepID=UPI003D718984